MKLIRGHWAEAVLLLVGVAAISVLVAIPFRPYPFADRANASTLTTEGRPDWETADQAQATTCHRELRDVPALLDQIRQGEVGISKTVIALTTLGPAAVPRLVPDLDDHDPNVRLVVTRTIVCLATRLEPQAAWLVPALSRRLHDPNTEIRSAAILALLSFGASSEAAIPALIAVLRDTNGLSEEDISCLQQGACHVLGRIGPNAQAAIPALNWVLHDDTSRARDAAATALWRISCDPHLVFPQLCSLLAETNSRARLQAVAALQRIRHDVEFSPELLAQVEAAKGGFGPFIVTEAP